MLEVHVLEPAEVKQLGLQVHTQMHTVHSPKNTYA